MANMIRKKRIGILRATIHDIYVLVLKEGYSVEVERAEQNGTYVFKLTNGNLETLRALWPRRTNDSK